MAHLSYSRIDAVDFARGLAAAVMIQGHAYEGWVAPKFHSSFAYQVTRFLGTFPLPAFLFLAGMSLALRVHRAIQDGTPAIEVRTRVVRRGISLWMGGYVVSAVYACIDGGFDANTLLRADVLHVIGLSLAVIGALGIRSRASQGIPDLTILARVAIGVGLVVSIACPWLSRLGASAHGPLRFVLGLFVDVQSITRMPFVPLVAWLCTGVVVATWLTNHRASLSSSFAAAGVPVRVLGMASVLGLACWGGGVFGTEWALSYFGGTLSRQHPAVLFNIVDLVGRAMVLFVVGALVGAALPSTPRLWLLRLGRGSLVAYVFHVPFAYGKISSPIAAQLPMATATAFVIALEFLSWWAVRVRDELVVRARRIRKKHPRWS